jgi:hypothetical protein
MKPEAEKLKWQNEAVAIVALNTLRRVDISFYVKLAIKEIENDEKQAKEQFTAKKKLELIREELKKNRIEEEIEIQEHEENIANLDIVLETYFNISE